jgi:hypothetical protein
MNHLLAHPLMPVRYCAGAVVVGVVVVAGAGAAALAGAGAAAPAGDVAARIGCSAGSDERAAGAEPLLGDVPPGYAPLLGYVLAAGPPPGYVLAAGPPPGSAPGRPPFCAAA